MKKNFNICDDNEIKGARKVPHLKSFQKLVSYINNNPFIQVVEYIGDETAYKPRPHGLTKDKNIYEYKRTAPSVLHNIAEELAVNNSVVGHIRS